MKFTFLSASMPLTKTYMKMADGSISKTSYPHAYEFTSHEEDVANLSQLEAQLIRHADLGHCLLKGNPNKKLVSESRAGSTNTEDPTNWLCFDIDGLDVANADTFMEYIGLGDVSYIIQWSASYGIENKLIRGHIFVMIDRMVPAPLIKQWLIHLNHTVPALRMAQSLTKTGNSLTWVLDITACQNDKLLYIAPPVLKAIKNPLGKDPRISLIKKKQDSFVFPAPVNAGKNRDLTDKRILELRADAGMPKRKLTYKVMAGHEVMVKPDSCDATEIKQERGFTYFNINGGDSWAYFHPDDNPTFIRNFKGEPTYLTAELLPEYWRSLQQAGKRTDADGLTYLAFCDRRTGIYWKGTYDAPKDELDLTQAKTLKILEHYMMQNGMPLGDFVPEWDLIYDPHDPTTVDFDNRHVNTFQLTPYMKAEHKVVTQCPPTIFKIVHHALGSDADITVHYMNWLAYIVQKRDMTITAWVMHGVEGTGKGLLIDNILRPLFGKNLRVVTMREVASPYNAFLQDALICVCEEMQSSAFENEEGVMGVMRQWIAAKRVQIRRMYALEVETRIYANWMFPSNKADAVKIVKGDRRYNIARYQDSKLYPTLDKAQAEIDKIPRELQAFYDFLYHYPVDEVAARTVLQTEDRDNMMNVSESAIDTASRSLLEGDMAFFIDQLPTSNRPLSNMVEANKLEDYKLTLRDILARTDRATGRVNIHRDELWHLFERAVGKMNPSPNKFTALLKHHRIHVRRVWVNDKTVAGVTVDFKDVADFDKYLKSHWPQSKMKGA